MKKSIFFILCVVWIILWSVITTKEMPEKFHNLKLLWKLSLEEKYKYLIGEDLYEFITFCKNRIPLDKTLSLRGDFTHYQSARAGYYLYPLKASEESDYVMVFKGKPLKDKNYTLVYTYGNNKYLYKKIERSE